MVARRGKVLGDLTNTAYEADISCDEIHISKHEAMLRPDENTPIAENTVGTQSDRILLFAREEESCDNVTVSSSSSMGGDVIDAQVALRLSEQGVDATLSSSVGGCAAHASVAEQVHAPISKARSDDKLPQLSKLEQTEPVRRGIVDDVDECAYAVHDLWFRSAHNGDLMNGKCRLILDKYSGMGPPWFQPVLLCPPATGPPPPSQCLSASSSSSSLYAQGGAEPAMPGAAQPPQQPQQAQQTQQPCSSTPAEAAMPAAASAPAELTIPEALARWGCLQAAHPDSSADAILAEVAIAVKQATHKQSESHRPDAEAVRIGFGEGQREQVVPWLTNVCMTYRLDDGVLFSAVQLLDRFCAASKEPIAHGHIHLIVCACLSLAIKVTGGADASTKPPRLRELLARLGQRRFPLEVVFAVELEVLQKLSFEVSAPTVLDFFSAFVLPSVPPPTAAQVQAYAASSPVHSYGVAAPGATEWATTSPVVILAKFLIQLTLLDAQVHYRYSHAALAAAATYIALWCLRARPERIVALLGEVAPLDQDHSSASFEEAPCLAACHTSSAGNGQLAAGQQPAELLSASIC